MGRPVKIYIFKRIMISLQHPLQSVAFGVADVAVQGETVGCSGALVPGELAAETEGWELFVRVVKLQNVSD